MLFDAADEELRVVLGAFDVAEERSFPVQIHTGINDRGISNTIGEYLPYCHRFPELHIDLAHGKPHEDVPAVLDEFPHVYVDTAFVSAQTVNAWLDTGVDERRIMFGSDLPAPQRHEKTSLTTYVPEKVAGFHPRISSLITLRDFYACSSRNSSILIDADASGEKSEISAVE